MATLSLVLHATCRGLHVDFTVLNVRKVRCLNALGKALFCLTRLEDCQI